MESNMESKVVIVQEYPIASLHFVNE